MIDHEYKILKVRRYWMRYYVQFKQILFHLADGFLLIEKLGNLINEYIVPHL